MSNGPNGAASFLTQFRKHFAKELNEALLRQTADVAQEMSNRMTLAFATYHKAFVEPLEARVVELEAQLGIEHVEAKSEGVEPGTGREDGAGNGVEEAGGGAGRGGDGHGGHGRRSSGEDAGIGEAQGHEAEGQERLLGE